MMKRHIIIMYMTLVFLTGCGSRSAGWQTGNVTLVRAVGVDLAEEGVALTAWSEGAERPLTARGPSVAEGMRTLRGTGNDFVHLGHTDQLLMSEAFARDGAAQLVDFVARDRQVGPGARLWVLRGEEGMPPDEANTAARLERLAGDREVGVRLDCSVTRLMSAMAGGDSVPVPALEWEAGELRPSGYAVLRQGRLVGVLEGLQSLGTELLCGRGAGQTVSVVLPGGPQLVLRVARADIRGVPRLDAGRLTGVGLHCSARFEVIQGAALTGEQRREAVLQAEKALNRRMAAALACAQFWDADFTGVERLTRMACSAREWSGVDWEREFRTLSLHVMASADVAWPADMAEE